MLIMHKGTKNPCNGEVAIDLTGIFAIFSEVSFTPKGIVVRNSCIESRSKEEGDFSKVNFICKECSQPLTVKDIVIACNHCYGYFPPEELVVMKTIGGTYCRKGVKELFKNTKDTIPLMEILTRKEVLIIR